MRLLLLGLLAGLASCHPTIDAYHSSDPDVTAEDINVATMHDLLGEGFNGLSEDSAASEFFSTSSSSSLNRVDTQKSATTYFISNGEDEIIEITVEQAGDYGLECVPASDLTQSAKVIVEESVDEGASAAAAGGASAAAGGGASAAAGGASAAAGSEGAAASAAAGAGAAASAAASEGAAASAAASEGAAASAAGGAGAAASAAASEGSAASAAATEGAAASAAGGEGSAASAAASEGAAASAASGGVAASSAAASEGAAASSAASEGAAASAASGSGVAASSAASEGGAAASAAGHGAAASSAASEGSAASAAASEGAAASAAGGEGAAASSAAGVGAASSAAASEGAAASSAAGAGAAASAASSEGAAASSAAGAGSAASSAAGAGSAASAAAGEGSAASAAAGEGSAASSSSGDASAAAAAGASASAAASAGGAAAATGGDAGDGYDSSEEEDEYEDVVERLEECVCVPYYLCKDGDIITDGEGLIDIRFNSGSKAGEEYKSTSQCANFLDVCCAAPLDSPDPDVVGEDLELYEPQCGRRNPQGINVQLDGFNEGESQFGEFPWMAIIVEDEDLGGQTIQRYVCGGSLVHPQIILTGAHCVHGKDPLKLQVRLGDWDTKHEKELYAHEEFRVASMVLHERFNKRTLFNDVALLFLETPVEMKPHIDTICLPQADEEVDEYGCVSTGFGKDKFHGGRFQNIMKQVDLSIVDRRECQKRLRTTKLGRFFRLDKSFTCAGGEEGVDTCKGDGGSPLVCPTKADPERYVQVGIVAWGIGCGEGGIPGVYASIPKLLPWINAKIAEKFGGGPVTGQSLYGSPPI